MLLVSWDTTRADALGAYSDVSHWDAHWRSLGVELPAPEPRTPIADGLAQSGLRYRWALSHAPTTLSAHAALFTGLDQHGHRVVRNGFPVPDELPLLTERFAEAGWHTVGVVGASVLEAEMGLSRGFAVYDDAVGTEVRNRFEDPAPRVVERLLRHVDARPAGKPLFAFAHFFDAHSPWDSAPDDLKQTLLDPAYSGPVDGSDESIKGLVDAVKSGSLPPEDARAARALYLAEVAAQDRALGALLAGLEERGLREDSLVVLVGDHGEALDDCESTHPYGHGPDVDLPLIHVPLVVSGRGELALSKTLGLESGTVEDTPVGLSEVGGLVLRATGLGSPSGRKPVISQTIFAEATKPFDALHTDGRWPNLPLERAAIGQGHMLLAAPWQGAGTTLLELDVGQPVAQPENKKSVGPELAKALMGWDLAAPAGREVELGAETREGLRALGYVEE